MFGVCILSCISLRLEASDKSESVSQVLFGEHFEILQSEKQWRKIKLQFDGYEGWIDSKQMLEISDKNYRKLSNNKLVMNFNLVDYLVGNSHNLLPITIGACINFLEIDEVNTKNLVFDGNSISGIKPKENLLETAFLFLNAPYLWGGKSVFGIDCSGFTQLVYKLNGYKLLRDASQQCNQGEALSFIEESEPGDLAFFDNDEGSIIHVGIIMKDNYIIHASGCVRIDRLDYLGIYNEETQKHTHRLRVIKKIV